MINIAVNFLIILNKSINMMFESFFIILKKLIILLGKILLTLFCMMIAIFYLYKYLTL